MTEIRQTKTYTDWVRPVRVAARQPRQNVEPVGNSELVAKKSSGSSLFTVDIPVRRRVSHAPNSAAHALPELSSVVTVHEIREGSKVVPKGSKGAIVFVHEGGAGYEVEFTEPVHLVISASRDDLDLAQC